MSFLDMELSKTFGISRTQQVLKEIHDHIIWEPLERILLAGYPVGKSPVGNAAYPQVMLLKAVLLQKWFRIRSDPELENHINNWVSFKVFVGLPLGDPSPYHSVISRFRDRIGSKVMERIHVEILGQLQKKWFSIDAGLAVDARLVRSASKPVSRDKVEEKKQERKQRKQDPTREPVKFGRDLESDWTKRKNRFFYGMKEHALIDVISGLVRSTLLSPASEHDTNYLQYVVVNGIHTKKLLPNVYADKGYYGQVNREFLHINDIADRIMRKGEQNATLTQLEIKRNKMISKVRYKIEQYFGVTALPQGAGRARFTTLAKEGWDRLCHAIAFNIKRSYRVGFRNPVPVPVN